MVSIVDKRNSNFELLRIISMFLIIFHHFIIHSNYDFVSNNTSFINNFFVALFQSGGKFGVVLFSMITGYFMVRSNIKFKKIIMLEGQVLFYSIILFVVFLVSSVGIEVDIWRFLLPNINEIYWFFSGYFILYLLIPYINKLIFALTKKEYFGLLGLGFIFLVLLPLFFSNRGTDSGIIYLFYYYIIGAYIRLYGDKLVDRKYYLFVFWLFYLLMPIFSMFIRNIAQWNIALVDKVWMFSSIDSIFVFGSAICLFLYFRNLNMKYNKYINLLASVSFGVYLFHDHPLVRNFLFKKLFLVEKLVLRNDFVFLSILIVIFIYLLGGVFDLIRQVIFKYFTPKRKSLYRIN